MQQLIQIQKEACRILIRSSSAPSYFRNPLLELVGYINRLSPYEVVADPDMPSLWVMKSKKTGKIIDLT